jgi:DNA modification methylase
MSVFLDDGDVRLYHGDALEQLRLLPDGCVDMVATSPPFYGLRDYGTGEWDGGDPDCDHLGKPHATQAGFNERYFGKPSGTDKQGELREPFKGECGKCGARRVDRQIGLEETPDQWVQSLVAVFRECRRVLADHGTLWVEIGDSYAAGKTGRDDADRDVRMKGQQAAYTTSVHDAPQDRKPPPGTKPKDLLGQPWLLAFALRADGWYLRSEIIWARPNPMPESVTDRPTKSHSTVFLLSKRPRYFYDADAIREAEAPATRDHVERYGHLNYRHSLVESGGGQPGNTNHAGINARRSQMPVGANARSVWNIPTEPTPFAHFATWPRKLVARMVQAGTSERGKCPVCGKPWVRQTETSRERSDVEPSSELGRMRANGEAPYRPNSRETGGVASLRTSTTVGWSPSCACALVSTANEHVTANPPPPVACVVLDPFAGSGTTLLVARHHGRHAIGIELNDQYLKIAADRLSQLSLLT